ncbi:MAG: GNAT family N-acetyltransferase [uncultured Thiotrichaceae bacterium]|uniref:GNAT family N-acetyltransferase n=1 Tax=uncultured Thiotrichaceae bacterium TaxID=298394 RepID=A0A6S6UA24_9GAMM|nr:MAG: GNAT family N-acetyltransferase [uncultured Thiotrichaceae bacterium]
MSIIKKDSINYEKIDPFMDRETTKEVWLDLQNRTEHSFFLSWAWIENWLELLPPKAKIQLIVGRLGKQPVICFFLGRSLSVDHKLILANRAYLNTSGHPCDTLTMEYNGLLVDKTLVNDTTSWLRSPLLKDVDEFVLPELSSDEMLRDSMTDFRLADDLLERTPSYFVDFPQITESSKEYISHLSKNKRAQIRRSLKEYGKFGEIKLKAAETADEAIAMLDNMRVLHDARWNQRNQGSIFDNDFFMGFHRRLIRTRFEQNEIRMLHVYHDSGTLGYLYYFYYKGEALFYQCGFNYLSGSQHYRPGLVSHYTAIMYFLESGAKKYNFLASDSQYKKSLATGHDELLLIRYQRKLMRFNVEKGLRRLKRSIDQLRARLDSAKFSSG